MVGIGRVRLVVAMAMACGIAALHHQAHAQAGNPPANALPNPYRNFEKWGTFPAGRTMRASAGLAIDRRGHLWVAERCGGNTCDGRSEAPILEFDPSGKLERSFGAGMFVFPHGIFVDRDQNVWVSDGDGANGKGHQVFKFSQDGKLLMTLGKKGVAGETPDTFNRPCDVVVAADGSIFVADGHAGDTNARIVKFSKEGKFLKTWGKKGSGHGEFVVPHAMAMDSRGRLFVADRGNNRIQIFDQEGRFLDEWKQFGQPSDVFIDANDVIFVTDIETTALGPASGLPRGIRIGSAKNGTVTAFIPAPEAAPADPNPAAEGLAEDGMGHLYAAVPALQTLRKYVKK